MIELVMLFMPGFVAMKIDKLINKNELNTICYLEKYFIYTLLLALLSFFSISVVVKELSLWNVLLDDVTFILKYLFMNVIYSIILPLVVNFVNDNLEFKITREKSKKK